MLEHVIFLDDLPIEHAFSVAMPQIATFGHQGPTVRFLQWLFCKLSMVENLTTHVSKGILLHDSSCGEAPCSIAQSFLNAPTANCGWYV